MVCGSGQRTPCLRISTYTSIPQRHFTTRYAVQTPSQRQTCTCYCTKIRLHNRATSTTPQIPRQSRDVWTTRTAEAHRLTPPRVPTQSNCHLTNYVVTAYRARHHMDVQPHNKTRRRTAQLEYTQMDRVCPPCYTTVQEPSPTLQTKSHCSIHRHCVH